MEFGAAGPGDDHEEREGSSVCTVCGAEVEEGDVEDTNGWRWFSDGKGGLHPLCPTCPPPKLTLVG
jgi:hypothetical protein